jgi:amidase
VSDIAGLLFRPATELAAMVRAGDVTAQELTEASFERIEALNDSINAFIWTDHDGALATAAAIGAGDPRPFAGVPICIKDIGPTLEGAPYTAGSEIFGDFVPPFDGAVVQRFKEAGFVIVGKTSTPEFGILPVTEPRRYGPTRNPWDTERTPGGSSGASAAAVAAGMVPIGHANDGGGSIRIPATCCGLVGLKPSRGRVSLAPTFGESMLVQDLAVTRTVEDTARVLDVLAGPAIGDASWAPPPAEPFANAAGRDPGRLRIGVALNPPIPTVVDPVALDGARRGAEALAALGHEVFEVEAPWGADEALFATFTVLWAVGIGSGVALASQMFGQTPSRENVESLTLDLYEQGLRTTAYEYVQAVGQLHAFSRGVIMWMDQTCDVLLTPALAQRPVRIGELNGDSEEPRVDFAKSGQFTPFTATCNISGQPAINVPLFHGDDGLPLGIHLIGKPLDEATLISVAAQLEAAHPWLDRRPELVATA